MELEIYDCIVGNTLFKIDLPPSEVKSYVSLIKDFGVEDLGGNRYKFSSVTAYDGGFIIYVEDE